MYTYEQILALDTQPGEVAIQQQRQERAIADMVERKRAENEERGIKYNHIHTVAPETVSRANQLRWAVDSAELDARYGVGKVNDGRSLISAGEHQQKQAAIAREKAEAELIETLGTNWRELLSTIRPIPLGKGR